MTLEKPVMSEQTKKSEAVPFQTIRRSGRVFPILVGFLFGLACWVAWASVESPSFYSLGVLVFGDQSPKSLFATPGYYCLHRTLLLLLAVIGGIAGMAISRKWDREAILWLLGLVLVAAVFASLFPQ